MRRRDFLATTAGLAATCLLPRPLLAQPRRRPNIVYILADDLGYGDLGCYGQARIGTPRLDQMAAEGTRFTQHYAGSTICAPSRCCLMTGKHTGQSRIRANGRLSLGADDVTVAQRLKHAGYATACFGKWGLGEEGSEGMPTRVGFDRFFGYLNQLHAHNYYPDYLVEDETRVAIPGNRLEGETRYGEGLSVERNTYSHDLFTERALQWLGERSSDQPFFLYLAYTIPHANNEARKLGMEVPSTEPYSSEDWPEPQKAHAAMITRMDGDVGRILDLLRERGLAEDTLVLFSSDNGPHQEGGADPLFFDSNGPLRGIKRDLFEGGIRVPLIAWQPGAVPAGATSDLPCAAWDFLPTACDLAGVPPTPDTNGVSLVPTLHGRLTQQTPHDHLYWECRERGGKQAIRVGNWKAVREGVRTDRDAPVQLFDLAADPGETTDLAAAQSSVATTLRQLMDDVRTESPEQPLYPV